MYQCITQDEVESVCQTVDVWQTDPNKLDPNTDESKWHANILKGKYPQRNKTSE